MRRKDREITDKDEIYSIMKEAEVCRIGFVDGNVPYIVPMNYGIADGYLYLHSAKEGRKIELLKQNNNVCFEMDILNRIVSGEKACQCTAKYKSVIGWGSALIVKDNDEKRKAFDIIMEKYSNKTGYKYTDQELDRVLIIKVQIENMTGKKSE